MRAACSMRTSSYFLWCCRAFQALLAQNEALSPHERLPESVFEVDPGLHDMVEAERREQEGLVRQVSQPSAVQTAAWPAVHGRNVRGKRLAGRGCTASPYCVYDWQNCQLPIAGW